MARQQMPVSNNNYQFNYTLIKHNQKFLFYCAGTPSTKNIEINLTCNAATTATGVINLTWSSQPTITNNFDTASGGGGGTISSGLYCSSWNSKTTSVALSAMKDASDNLLNKQNTWYDSGITLYADIVISQPDPVSAIRLDFGHGTYNISNTTTEYLQNALYLFTIKQSGFSICFQNRNGTEKTYLMNNPNSSPAGITNKLYYFYVKSQNSDSITIAYNKYNFNYDSTYRVGTHGTYSTIPCESEFTIDLDQSYIYIDNYSNVDVRISRIYMYKV